MSEPRDASFGQIAIREGQLTEAKLAEAIEIQERLRSLGAAKKIGEVLVEKGSLTKEQVEAVLQVQKQLEERRKIEGYEILALLGKGGMGTVYKARQVSLDRVVALKVLPPRYNRDKAFIRKFFDEARTIAKLNHENIVSGIDVGESNGLYYFTMEFVDGETVSSIIERDGPLPERQALEIARQICRALAHAQKNGLVHRDVKPQNIMLTRTGVAKLCDLGLAKSDGGPGQGSSADGAKGLSIGTPHYISPEQARGETDVDIRSDIYSLGATLYHLVTGQTPFEGTSPMVLMTKHLTEEPVPIRKRDAKLSRGLGDLVAKMMRKARDERHQTPLDVIEDIEKVLKGKPLGHGAKPKRGRGAARAAGAPRAAAGGARRPEDRGGRRSLAVAVARKPRGVGLPVVVVAILAVLAAIILLAHHQAQQRERLRPGADRLQDPPEARVGTEAQEQAAKAALDAVFAYRSEHPDDTQGIVERLDRVAAEHAGTQAAANAAREAKRLRQGR